MTKARILLADDHNIVLEAIKKLLEPEFDVIATVSNGLTLIQEARRLRPDVIVMDLVMRVLDGLEVGRKIKAELPEVKFIYLTTTDDADIVAEAFRIGASEFLLKQCGYSDLRAAIRRSLDKGSYLGRLIPKPKANRDFRHSGNRETGPITPRQREVLRLLAEGRSMKQVAFALDLSTRTVAFHKYRMMAGLNLRTNADLIRFAMTNLIV